MFQVLVIFESVEKVLNLVLREKTATFVMFINQVSNIYRTLDALPIEGLAKVKGSAVRTKRKSVSRKQEKMKYDFFGLDDVECMH